MDWAESLQTQWYSTIWGFLFVASQGLTAIGFAILAMWLLGKREPMSQVLQAVAFSRSRQAPADDGHALGVFLFLAIADRVGRNLPHEISYYLPRFATSWGWLGVALIVVQFLIPFLLLLNMPLKRNAALLSGVVAIVLVMRYMGLVWFVLPGYHKAGFHMSWLTVAVPLGLGCIWLWAFFGEWMKRPLLPLHDAATGGDIGS